MPDRALEVVEEFLNASEMRIAENAVVALSTLDSEESLDHLVALSLGEQSRTDLRQQALEALAGLQGGSRDGALARLHAALENPRRQARAYAVLGRLRERGIEVGDIRRPLRERWALAESLSPARRKRVVVAQAALRAGTVGLVITVLVFLILNHNPRLESVLLLGILALLLAVVTTVFASRRAVPCNRYPDPHAGIAWEVGKAVRSALFGGLVALFVAMLALLLSASSTQVTLARLIGAGTATAALVVGTAALARAGTLLSRGVATGPDLNLWIQTITGAALPWLFLTFTALLAIGAAGEDRGGHIGPIADLLWLILLPTCAAMGHAFAMVDRQAKREDSLVRPWIARGGSGLIVVLFATMLAFAAGREPPLERGVALMQGASLVLERETLPASWGVQLTGADSVLVVAEALSTDTADLTLTLYYPPPSEQKLVGDDPDRVERVLKPGLYWIALSRFDVEDPGAPRTTLLPRDLLRRLFMNPEGRASSRERADSLSPRYQVHVRRLPAEMAAERARARVLSDSAFRLARQDLMLRAVEVMQLVADGPAKEVIPAGVYDRLCWRGSLSGLAQRVLGYCNRAVHLEPTNATYLDSRALARALTGDRAGAIADYGQVLQKTTDVRRREIREGFVRKLRAGQPLTDADLRPLRQPYSQTPLPTLRGDLLP